MYPHAAVGSRPLALFFHLPRADANHPRWRQIFDPAESDGTQVLTRQHQPPTLLPCLDPVENQAEHHS